MNIYDVLRHEHYVIRACLKRIQELGERRPATRQRQLRQLQALFSTHAAAAEAIFQEPLLEHEAAEAPARQARVRQDLAASLMEVLAGLPASDPDWIPYFTVLAEVLELYMRQSEKDVFRKARKVLDAETEVEMGEAMLQAGKGREVMARAEIQPPVVGEGSRSLH